MVNGIFDKKHLLSCIVESSNDAIFSKDLDGKILSWNRSAERMYGYTSQEAIGKSIYEFVPPEKHDEVTQILLTIRSGEVIERMETVRLTKYNKKIDISLSVSPVKDSEGKIIGAAVIAQDITESKRAREMLLNALKEVEDLYNNAPCGYHSLDKDGMIIRINDTELKWLGYTREEVVGKMRIFDLYTPESRTRFIQNFPRFMETGYVQDLRFELIRKDGTAFHVLLSATAVKDSDGNYLMSRTVVYDITELKKAEDERERLYRELLEVQGKLKVLRGLLPICASCKKIRNDQGLWDSIEKYVSEHSEAEFTHSLCMDCAKRLYPEYYEELIK